MRTKAKAQHNGAEKPVSLRPLKFEEAVSDLLSVEPEPKKGSKKKTGKAGKEDRR